MESILETVINVINYINFTYFYSICYDGLKRNSFMAARPLAGA